MLAPSIIWSTGLPQQTEAVLQRLGLIICLFLGAALFLMPQASGAAAHEAQMQILQHEAHGAMPAPARCPSCDQTRHNDAQHTCPTMGAACGAMAGCGVAISVFAQAPISDLQPRDLPLHPALSRGLAQRALVPEPPPPRL